jgi:hypothetical protein
MRKILVYFIFSILIFTLGGIVGKADLMSNYKKLDSSQNEQPEKAVTDLNSVAQKYANVVSFCEQKYQYALKGDKKEAEKINSQMNGLVEDINKILENYSSTINTESY